VGVAGDSGAVRRKNEIVSKINEEIQRAAKGIVNTIS